MHLLVNITWKLLWVLFFYASDFSKKETELNMTLDIKGKNITCQVKCKSSKPNSYFISSVNWIYPKTINSTWIGQWYEIITSTLPSSFLSYRNINKQKRLKRLGVQFLDLSNFLAQWVASSLCHPRDCSTPGFTVLHNLAEFA